MKPLKIKQILVLLAALVITFCLNETTARAVLSIDSPAKKVKAGKSYTLTVQDASGSLPEDADITWTLSNQKATITGNTLKAVRAGKIKLTASYNGEIATRTIRIRGKQIVCIDPGHQGRGNSSTEPIGPGASSRKAKVASGTTGVATHVPEFKLNLTVAKKVRKLLLARGYEVVMTRTTHNINISNSERAILANNSGAAICVRIHANGSANHSVAGALTMHTSSRNRYTPGIYKKSKKLSTCVVNSFCKATGARNLGCLVTDELTGSNWSKIPVTVVEMGFMSNPTEDRKMQNKAYQDKMVVGIVNGIDAYFK